MRDKLLSLSTPMLADARHSLELEPSHLDPGIRPLVPYTRMAGEAVTVRLEAAPDRQSADLTPLVRAYETQSRSSCAIMVTQVPVELHQYGIFGEGGATMALGHGFVGVLIEGAVRDSHDLRPMGFPVFHRTIAPGFMGGLARVASLGEPVVVGGRTIRQDDVIAADNDGVIVIRPDELDDLLARALAVQEWEIAHNALMAQGKTHEEGEEIVGPMP